MEWMEVTPAIKLALIPSQWCSGKESRRHKICGFDPWVGKIPWRRKWQPTPVFLPGESHGQRGPEGYSPRGHKDSEMNERLSVHKHNILTVESSASRCHLVPCPPSPPGAAPGICGWDVGSGSWLGTETGVRDGVLHLPALQDSPGGRPCPLWHTSCVTVVTPEQTHR